MRYSLQRRFVAAVGVSLVVGLTASGYILQKFRSYEDSASRVMSGDQRTVIQGHLLEARVTAAIELAQASVNSEQANEAFKEKIQKIGNDLKALSSERPDKSLEEAKRTLGNLVASKAEAMEDLFVHYRNLKTSAFNIYRAAWANKWMTVAHNVGLIINDLDNLPYQQGDKAASSIYSKVGPLVALITRAPLPQDAKLQLFGQLNALKSQVAQYNEATQRSEKIRAQRVEDLNTLATLLKKYNEAQGKTMLQFGNEARAEVFKAVLAFLLLILFSLAWYAATSRRFSKHVLGIGSHIARQLGNWINPGGNMTTQGFIAPEKPDLEFEETYRAIDQVMRRVATLRKEDVLVKRLLNVPFMLIGRNRQAIFWNSALSILGKVRALEETGAVPYTNLLRFTSGQGKAVDPIDKCFETNHDVSALALLRVGEDGLAVQVLCTPVLGTDHQTEYVVVHVRDLREENRRAEAELDRQLDCVRTAIQQIRAGRIPIDAPAALRKPVIEAIQLLKTHALELQEKAATVSGQVETMRGRMKREADLKKAVHGRMSQVQQEVTGVRGQLGELRTTTDSMVERMKGIEARGNMLRDEYEEVRRRGGALLGNLKASQNLVSECLKRLEETEEISSRVRANERMIRSILEKSTVLNANNSILGTKRELTPTDVVTITENLTQLMGQFERSYRFIEQSVADVEKGLGELGSKLKENLSACAKLASEDQDIVRIIRQSENLVEANTEEVNGFGRDVAAIKSSAQRVAAQIKAVENKVQALVQIGQASLELQTQLELGFRGMFETSAPPQDEVSGQAGGRA